jgi:hypothetical protein
VPILERPLHYVLDQGGETVTVSDNDQAQFRHSGWLGRMPRSRRMSAMTAPIGRWRTWAAICSGVGQASEAGIGGQGRASRGRRGRGRGDAALLQCGGEFLAVVPPDQVEEPPDAAGLVLGCWGCGRGRCERKSGDPATGWAAPR